MYRRRRSYSSHILFHPDKLGIGFTVTYDMDLWTETSLQICAYPHGMTELCTSLVITNFGALPRSPEHITWLPMEQVLQAVLGLGF